MSNLTTSEDSQPMITSRLVVHPKTLGTIIINLTTSEDSRHMISNWLVSHPKHLGAIISELISKHF